MNNLMASAMQFDGHAIVSTRERSAARLLLLLAIGYALVVVVLFPKWTVDDAFITYRYAENLAMHGELNWNVGEDPVEGYTGLVLPVLLAGAVRAGIDVDAASKSVGVASFLLCGLLLACLVRRLGCRPVVVAVAAVLYLTVAPNVTHALSGLETMLFTAFEIASLIALTTCIGGKGSRALQECLLLGLLLGTCLVRPEGLALAASAFSVLAFVRIRSDRSGLLRFLLRVGLILGLPLAAYFLVRHGYYGDWFPNTYYAKWTRRFSRDSLSSLLKFSLLYAVVPLLAGAAATVSWVRWRPGSGWKMGPVSTAWATLAAGILFVAACAALYLKSALAMNFSYRFFIPFLPIVFALAAVLVERGLRRVGTGRLVPAICAGALIVQLAVNIGGLPREIRFANGTIELLADEHAQVADFLRERVPPGEWLVVVLDAGVIPYRSKLKTVDFGGLNDEFLSRRWRERTSSAKIVDYFFARNPAAAVFTSTNPDTVDGPEPAPITVDPRFGNYSLVAIFGSSTWPNYYQMVYLRRDLCDRLSCTDQEKIKEKAPSTETAPEAGSPASHRVASSMSSRPGPALLASRLATLTQSPDTRKTRLPAT